MYYLRLWNNAYGNKAKFVVEDADNHKFTEFTPSRPKDIAWTSVDLTKNKDYAKWDDWGKEEVEDLNEVIM